MKQAAQLTFWRQAPTMRDVADTVRAGGTEALTDADCRADQARYQEVSCKSALNRTFGMPFSWTLNPYRGCTHGCHYCYARKYHKQFEMNADDEFASVILVKTNVVEVLRRELRRPSWMGELVAIGSATDCYQPIEGHYKLTRGALEVLLEHGNPASVVTKGPMIVRDKDLLARLSAIEGSGVYVSVPCADDAVCAELEPGTARPAQRLRAARELADAGVRVRILMSPIVPGLSSKPSLIERTVKACAAHGVRIAGGNVMHLEEGARTHFFAWLEREHPELVPGYRDLYRGKSVPAAYAKEVARVLGNARATADSATRPASTSRAERPPDRARPPRTAPTGAE
jgi:DNA repair photolyase